MISSQNNVRKYRTKGHEQVLCIQLYNSDELDCVAMLLFPREPFIAKYNLVVGSRLITVNMYKNNFKFDQDLIVGPFYHYAIGSRQHRSRWSGFVPIIADFVTDDLTRVEIRKDHIEEGEWDRAYKMGKISSGLMLMKLSAVYLFPKS